MSTRLLLVRHGETPATIGRLFVGSTDVELTAAGHEQARAVARRLKHARIDALYVSPLKRCVQTASAIVEATGLKPRTEPAVRECDFGSWEGLSFAEVFQKDADGVRAWLIEEHHSSHGGESRAELAERAWTWWEQAAQRHAGETICVVAHGGPIRCILQRAMQASVQAFLALEIDPASISLLQTEGSALRAREGGQDRAPSVRVRFVNDTQHLGDPLRPSEPPSELPP